MDVVVTDCGLAFVARVAIGVAGIVLAAVAACVSTVPRRIIERMIGG